MSKKGSMPTKLMVQRSPSLAASAQLPHNAALDMDSAPGKSAPDQAPPSDLRYVAMLRAQLARSLTRLLALAEPGDAAAVPAPGCALGGEPYQAAAAALRYAPTLQRVVSEAADAGCAEAQSAWRGLALLQSHGSHRYAEPASL